MPRAATAAARKPAPIRKPAARGTGTRKPAARGATTRRGGAHAHAQRGETRPTPKPKRSLRIVPRDGVRPAALGSGLIDRLLRGRAWIAFLGVALVGVVFLNVSLLEINRGITAKAERIAELKRANAQKRVQVAELASSERIQQAASDRGFLLPEPGKVSYLSAAPTRDARRAAEAIVPPTSRQQAPAATPAPAPAEQTPPPVAQQAPPAVQQQPAPTQPSPVQQAPPQAAPPPTGAAPHGHATPGAAG